MADSVSCMELVTLLTDKPNTGSRYGYTSLVFATIVLYTLGPGEKF